MEPAIARAESEHHAQTVAARTAHHTADVKLHEPLPESATARQQEPLVWTTDSESHRSMPDAAYPTGSEDSGVTFQIPAAFRKSKPVGDINPLSGKEYLTNTVRRHPEIEEFVQVYDQATHSWSDVREDYFWEFQEKKKQMMGNEYKAPIQI
jgi:hypothetical protein